MGNINLYPRIQIDKMNSYESVEPGIVWTIGNNASGVIGTGTTENKHISTYVQVSLPQLVKQIAGGQNDTFFILEDGSLYGTGYNYYGELGVGNTSRVYSPVQISNFTNVKQVATAYYHSLFLLEDGTVWGCGRRQDGQLGNGISGPVAHAVTPIQISGIDNVKQICAGDQHSIFLKNDGTVWVCGSNSYGKLGIETEDTLIDVPTQIPDISNVKQVCGAQMGTIILKEDGSVYSCGRNGYGEIGQSDVPTLTPIPGLDNINKIIKFSCGYYFMFLSNDDLIYACGRDRGNYTVNTIYFSDVLTPQLTCNFKNINQVYRLWLRTFIIQGI